MNKFYTTLLLSVFAGIIVAQPTITSSEGNPQVGESFEIATGDLQQGMQGAAGANVTWDFSNLTTVNTQTLEFVDPAATGQGATFSNSNLAYSIAPGSWDMVYADNTGFSRAGVINNNFPIVFSNPEQLYFWPATYGDINSDDFEASWTNVYNFVRSGTLYSEVDAYGDLILPGGTIENVLRFKITEDYQDDYTIYGISQTLEYDSEIYIWYKEGVHYPVMSLSYLVAAGQPNIISSFAADVNVGLFDTPQVYNAVEVFPNPTTSFATLSIDLESTKQVRILVTDILGQAIMQVTNQELAAGEHDFTIDLSTFSKGVYLVKSEIDNTINTQRVVVQ